MSIYAKSSLVLAAVLACGVQHLVSGQQAAPRKEGQAAKAAPADHHHPVSAATVTRAVCVLHPTADQQVSGVIYFTKKGSNVEVSGTIKGLTPGKHGFHVHEFGDVTDGQKGLSAGGHFNPHQHRHGKQEDEERHVGDLGNVEANAQGIAQVQITDSHLKLDGPTSILGRGLVVHAGEDKFTQPVGDAGGRVAVGVIGIASPEAGSAATKK